MDATIELRAPYPKNAPEIPDGRTFRVTAYRVHYYWGYATKCFVVGDFRWYWLANLVSFICHHVFRYGCNTWKKDD
jgi:hypothetical protein